MVLAACVLFGLACPPVCRAGIDLEYTNAYLDRANDWVLFLDVFRLSRYLKYQESRLYPITNLRIAYRVIPGPSSSDQPSTGLYEDLWYHDGVPVGCRRYCQLPVQANRIGSVVLRHLDGEADESRVVANAIVRLTLDLSLQESSATGFVVPLQLFDQIAQDLGSYGFLAEPNIWTGPQISIRLVSSPPVKSQLYYFRKAAEWY